MAELSQADHRRTGGRGREGHAADRGRASERHRNPVVLLLRRFDAASRLPHVPGGGGEDPKLQVGCTLPVAEGMIVHTDSPIVKQARKGTLEFLLTNHPLDCPVCDKGGECELQDMVFRYGAGESRFSERKVHVDEKQWSPVVFFDAPRCILCYRCVRVCNEGMGVNALGVANRGVISEIRSQSSRSSGMRRVRRLHRHLPGGRAHQRDLSLSDAALGDESRRHHLHALRRRMPHHLGRAQRQDHPRQQSRPVSGINGEFLCIKGRYGFDFVEHPERLQSPMLRSENAFEPISWSKALETIAAKFTEVKARGGKFGVIGSNHTTNEENFFLAKLARQGLGTRNIDHHRTGDLATFSMRFQTDRNVLATTADLYDAKAVLVTGADLSQQHPFLAYQIRAERSSSQRARYTRSRPARCARTIRPWPAFASKRAGNWPASSHCVKSSRPSRSGHPVRRCDSGRRAAQVDRVRRFAGHPGEVRLPGGLFEFARRLRYGPGPARWRMSLASRCSRRPISTCCGWWARIR
jgi:ferredoxin